MFEDVFLLLFWLWIGCMGVMLAISIVFTLLGGKRESESGKKENKPIKRSLPPTKEELVVIADKKLKLLESRSIHKPILALVIGGIGVSEKPGAVVYLGTTDKLFIISSATDDDETEIPIESITSIDISGPGTQTNNAGIVGGGFGVEGALKGMIAASLINAATTRKKTDTFLRILTKNSEVHFHLNNIEPSGLRLLLSHLFVAVENRKSETLAQPKGLAEEIAKLKSLNVDGAISDEEFAQAKKKLLGV